MNSGQVLVTGANGFIGHALFERLREASRPVRGTVRTARAGEAWVTASLQPDSCWRTALDGVDVVVHTAARVHQMQDRSIDPLALYRQTNTEGTLNLARQAAEQGVRRFVFVSSIKVLGEQSKPGHPFRAGDPLAPQDPYATSKAEAEQKLRELEAANGLEVVIVRPPLVYGPGVGANFLTMMRWLARGYPLPFAGIDNRRSLIALGNLVDLLIHCCNHPDAGGRTLLAADGEDLSTPELLRRLGQKLGRSARLFRAPPGLNSVARWLGKGAEFDRLQQSLQIDTEPTRKALDWTPPVTVDQALARTAAWFRSID